MRKLFHIAIIVCVAGILVGCRTSNNPTVSLPTTHVLQEGEDWADFVPRYYGENNMLKGIEAIARANPEYNKVTGIPVGTVLKIPKLSE